MAPTIDNSAGLSSALARDWILEVRKDSEGDWTPVLGLKSVSPIFEGNEQDDSDIYADGYGSQIVTGISFRVEGSGIRKGPKDDGKMKDDEGQALLRERGRKVGVDNFVEARVYRRDDLPDAYQATTTVKWTDQAASDTDALQEFSFTLSSRGKPENIDKPEGGDESGGD